jgi:hypothetical protein
MTESVHTPAQASILAHAPTHCTRPSGWTDGLGASAPTHVHMCLPSPQTKLTGLPLPCLSRRGAWALASRRLCRTPPKRRPPVRHASPRPHTIPVPIHAPTHARTGPPHPPARRLACHPAPCPPARRAAGLAATRRASPPRPALSPRPPPALPRPHRCYQGPRACRACPPPT